MVDRHGFPKFDELKWRKDEDGSNIIWISLFDKPDSLMNLKKCDLMVYFYPDSLITSTDKFLSYHIYTELLIAPSKKIIEAPLIKIE